MHLPIVNTYYLMNCRPNEWMNEWPQCPHNQNANLHKMWGRSQMIHLCVTNKSMCYESIYVLCTNDFAFLQNKIKTEYLYIIISLNHNIIFWATYLTGRFKLFCESYLNFHLSHRKRIIYINIIIIKDSWDYFSWRMRNFYIIIPVNANYEQIKW